MKNIKKYVIPMIFMAGAIILSSCTNARDPEAYRNDPNCREDQTIDKPVIYLYPEEETDVSVRLSFGGRFTCTYPSFDSGSTWEVTAKPDGTILDKDGTEYGYLFWEGIDNKDWDMSEGYCVEGAKTAKFLENAAAKLGLDRKEATDFITYWLPQMKDNPYNVIAFQTDDYERRAGLTVTPQPDSIIRVFMTWYPSEKKVDIPAQKVTIRRRKGFSVIEWGGTKVNSPDHDGEEEFSSLGLQGNIAIPASVTPVKPQGHPFTDKNGEKTVFTEAEWQKLLATWAYTGEAEEMITHHTIKELRAVLNM